MHQNCYIHQYHEIFCPIKPNDAKLDRFIHHKADKNTMDIISHNASYISLPSFSSIAAPYFALQSQHVTGTIPSASEFSIAPHSSIHVFKILEDFQESCTSHPIWFGFNRILLMSFLAAVTSAKSMRIRTSTQDTLMFIVLISFAVEAEERVHLTEWNISSAKYNLPRPATHQIIGYNQNVDSIILFGGWPDSVGNQMVEYQLNPLSMIDKGSNVLNIRTLESGQRSVQHGNTLYFAGIDPDATSTENQISYMPSKFSRTCITSFTMDSDYLILVRKVDAFYRSGIFNISNNSWSAVDSVPSTIINRQAATCHVIDQKIFAIAGQSGEDSIETLDISNGIENIINYSWEFMENRLSISGLWFRSVSLGSLIMIFNGFGSNGYNSNIYKGHHCWCYNDKYNHHWISIPFK